MTLALAVMAIGSGPALADVAAPGEKPGFFRRIFGGGNAETPPPPAPAPVPAPQAPTPGPKPKVTTIKPKSSGGSKSSKKSSSTAKKAPTKKSTSTSTAKKKPTPSSSTKATAAAKAEPKKEEPKKEEAKTETVQPQPTPAAVAETKPETETKSDTATAETAMKPDAEGKPEAAEAEKMVESAPKGDSEFSVGGDEDKPEATTAAKSAPAAESRPPAPTTPLPTSSKNGGWQVVKVSGRDYVTGESIHQFYRFSSYKVDGKHVWLRSNNLILKAQVGSQEMLINNIKFILSFPVLESGGKALFSRLDLCKLIDPVLRPTYITDAVPFDTVVLDAGHGGHDVGARGIYGYEKDFALKMSFAVRDALVRKGFKVVMTRTTDKYISLGGRVSVANATPNSIFISLHFNAGGNNIASGIETFALTPQGSSASLVRGGGYNASGLTGNSHDSANIALATAVHAMVISKFKFVDRGIKRAQWSVLTGCKRPGILFEGGFVTNGPECRLIASDTYRQSVSTAIAEAVNNYRTALRGALTNRR